MKTVNANFEEAINAPVHRPNFAIKIYFGLDKTDPVWFTSHKNTPVPTGETVYRNVIAARSVSGKTQKLNPLKANSEIGSLSFRMVDYQNQITDLLYTKYNDTTPKALRNRFVELYVGYGNDFDNYELLFTQKITGDVGYQNGVYDFKCADIQREQNKKLFIPKETRLTSSIVSDTTGVDISFNASGNEINATDTELPIFTFGHKIRIQGSAANSGFFTVVTSTASQITTSEAITTESAGPGITISQATIEVSDTSAFLAVDHGTSYADAQSEEVGYIKIDKMRVRWGSKSSTRFDDVVLGVLNTRSQPVEVDSGITDTDKLPKVSELFYLEMPSLKMAYALLTGVLYNQAGKTLPEHWHSGIDTTLVNIAEFLQFADMNLWDSTDDLKGQRLRFVLDKSFDGKKFIEEKIMKPSGCFMIIRSDGAIGVRKMDGVLSTASTVATMDKSNVFDISGIRYDNNEVFNQYKMNWNYILGKPTRINLLLDNISSGKYDFAALTEVNLDGVYGNANTKNDLANIMDALRDRHAGAPFKATVRVHPMFSRLEIGDIVKLKLDHIADHTSPTKTLDRAVEIQRITVDYFNGVTCDVFGSTEQSNAILHFTDGTSAGSSFVTSRGTALTSILTAQSVPFTDVGGVLTISGSFELAGGVTMADGVYYYDGAIVGNNTSDTITINDNCQIVCTDAFTWAGSVDGAGRGVQYGESGGTVGSSRGSYYKIEFGRGYHITNTPIVAGQFNVAPYFNLSYDGTTLTGLDGDLRGVPGALGPTYSTPSGDEVGGDGGSGGASLAIVSDGCSFTGSTSTINLSGTNGLPSAGNSGDKLNGGSGDSGILVTIGLTALSTVTGVSGKLICRNGDVDVEFFSETVHRGLNDRDITSFVMPQYNRSTSYYRNQFFPTSIAAVEDLPEEADKATVISLTENVNTPNTPAENLASITVTVTPPTTDGYSYSNIYWRVQGQTEWIAQGPASPTWVIQRVPMDGVTYEVAAFPVSTTGVESTEYIFSTITMSVAKGGVVLETGNYVKTSSTVGDAINGEGIIFQQDRIEAYDSTGTAKVTIDGSTGIITATDVNLSGTISATAGTIGGWTVSSTELSTGTGASHIELNPSTGIFLGADTFATAPFKVSPAGALTATNVSISSSGTGSVTIDSTGIVGNNGTIDTFKLLTDGSAPEFSNGTIKEFEYQLYTSGIIRTSSTANRGVVVDNSGVRGYDSIGTKVFDLNATTGEVTAVTFTTTSGSGKRIEVNPSADNEIHFYGDRGDATIEELATIGITTIGSDNIILRLGSANTTQHHCIYADNSSNASGIYSYNRGVGSGVYGRSGSTSPTASGGVYGYCDSGGAGVVGKGPNGYGGYFSVASGGSAPIWLGASASSSAPTHAAGLGSLWVTSSGILYINTSGSTTWQKVGAQ